VCTGGAPPDCTDASCDPEGLEGNCDTPTPEDPPVAGETVTIEPDDYADGTDLTNISPHVVLSTTQDDNIPVSNFPVTANDDGFDFAPTGSKVFGHANVQFFNNDRRLRMDFTVPVQVVEIYFAGGTYFETEVGRLQVFDETGNLLVEAVTTPKEAGFSELLSITRSSADIAWAVAYVAEDEGNFGRFDALSFTIPSPQP
jgi:hypothetical protein